MPNVFAPQSDSSLTGTPCVAERTFTPEVNSAGLVAEAERLLATRHLPEALKCFSIAEEAGANPDLCAAGRWKTAMLLGEYEHAWQQADAIRSRAAPDPHRFWQGEDLAGRRVILRCLHGFGDAVQFLRYVPKLKAIVSQLIVEVPPRFIGLAKCFNGIDHVITWGADSPSQPAEWEVQLEVMELPYIFRTQLGDLPISTRYLRVPTAPALDVEKRATLRVGLAWVSGSWNPKRAISLDALQPILSTEGCEFWSLCEGSQETHYLHDPSTILKGHAHCSETIEGLAATIAGLDLIITVDTLAAHLGGAIGVRTWVLLPYEGDWRWMHDRSESPWYPTVRLFRQPSPGDWRAAVASLLPELQGLRECERERRMMQP